MRYFFHVRVNGTFPDRIGIELGSETLALDHAYQLERALLQRTDGSGPVEVEITDQDGHEVPRVGAASKERVAGEV